MSSDAARLAYTNVSLADVIAQSYRVQHTQIAGPGWLDSQRFDILAKIPADVPKDRIPDMLQSLLADRFRLQLHRETRELPVYSLSLAKSGPKLPKADSSGGLSINDGRGRSRVTGRVTLAWFADFLSQRLDRPVQDQTGLEGVYTVNLEWVRDSADVNSPAPSDAGASLFTALQEQLGLRLVAAKGPVEVLVVDRLEKTPTEN